MKFSLCFSLVLAACAPSIGDPLGYAVDVFTENHYAPSEKCLSVLSSVVVNVVSAEEIASICNVPLDYAWGCRPSGTDSVYVESGADPVHTAHELEHVLLECEGFSSEQNHDHKDDVWSSLS